MRLIGFVLALLFLLPAKAPAQQNEPLLLRIAVSPEGLVSVNQRVTVTLTVMTPVRFVDPPQWPDLSVTGGKAVILPEATTLPGTERVGGESYAALQRNYALFPATPGSLTVNPFTMTLRVGGPDGQPVEAKATTRSLEITSRIPPGITDITRLVVAPNFQLSSSLEGARSDIQVGQAVTRHLHMEADGTTAMLLPPVIWGAVDGVRIYPDPPALQDHAERGQLHAVRNESAAFVPQRPGDIVLPGFTVDWLEPATGRLQKLSIEPIRLTVLSALPTTGVAHRVPSWWAWLLPLVLLPGGALWWWWRRRAARGPDPVDALAAACRADDARAAAVALYRWADARLPPGGERQVARLADLAGTPELAQEADALGAQIYGAAAAGAWQGAPLLAAARKADSTLHHPQARPSRGTTTLPPLNPLQHAPAARLTQPRWAR
ncbi:hypothetical protein ACFOD4_19160 [Pseudoroseomonas globiformis]|uniref:DUF7939 domain-containing protein n=1 Tax=Teichococcus globiformis TaxID=2307229 RepID=A0ABV7G874_9PROT